MPLWAVAALTSSSIFATLAALFGAATCAGWLWSRLGYGKSMVNFLSIGGFGLCLVQNFAWLTSAYVHAFTYHISIESSLFTAEGVNIPVSYYSAAVLYITVISSVLVFLGMSPWFSRNDQWVIEKLRELFSISASKIGALVGLVTLMNLVLIVGGVVGGRTLNVEGFSEGSIPWWFFVFESLGAFHLFLNGALGAKLLKERKKGNLHPVLWALFIFSLLVVSFLFFTKGRRLIVFLLLSIAWWGIFFLKSKPRLWITLLVILLGYPIISEALVFNNFMRSSKAGLIGNESMFHAIPKVWEEYQKYEDLQQFAEDRSTQNLATRPLVARPLASCMALPADNKSFILHKDILHSLIWSIPGPLIRDKNKYALQENLLYSHFPIGTTDTSDSIYLAAYTSFGWFGLVVYPCFLASIWLLVTTMMRTLQVWYLMIGLIVALWLKYFLLDISEGSTLQIFVNLRSTFFWCLIGYGINYFVSPSPRRRAS